MYAADLDTLRATIHSVDWPGANTPLVVGYDTSFDQSYVSSLANLTKVGESKGPYVDYIRGSDFRNWSYIRTLNLNP